MKKTMLFVTMFFPLIAATASFGFVESRLQWWEVRLRKLAAERAEMQKNSEIDPKVLGLIDGEMKRARDLIAVFETDMKDDGSLTHETRVMTESDIMAEARRTVPPLCAIRRMEILADEIGSVGALEFAREIVRPRVAAMVRGTFGKESGGLAAAIMTGDIRPDEWKNLAAEILIGGMIAGRARMEEDAVNAVAGRMGRLLKEKNSTSNERELRAMAAREALEYLEGAGEACPADSGAALDASWSWREIRPSIERNLESYRKIIAMTGASSDIAPERVRELHRRPADLDAFLFKSRHARYLNDAASAGAESAHAMKGVSMEIPAVPRNLPVLEEIDRLRKPLMLSVTGREDRKFFEDLKMKISAVIKRHTEPTKTLFSREEERLLRGKEGGRHTVANEDEFRNASRRFDAGAALLNEYGNASHDALALLSESKQMSAGAIVEDYRYRVKRNEEYLRFARGLAGEGTRISAVENRRAHAKLSAVMARIGSVFRYAGSTLTIDRRSQSFLTKRDITAIRSLKADFTGTMYSLRADMRSSYGRYSGAHSAAEGSDKKARKGLRELIAQDEIDAHYSHARECIDLYGQFTYGEDALERYGETFNAFLKEARSGAASTGLEYAITMNTLALSVKDFDGERLRHENATKCYLRKEAKTALSRLAYLLLFYKKNRIAISDEPRSEEIGALENAIIAHPSVKIDSWTMNETNFAEIDKKAIQKLSLCVNRASLAAPARAPEETPRGDDNTSVAITEQGLSLSMPRGWKEGAVADTESYLGVVKLFRNAAIDSSVRLVSIPLAGGDAKSAAESWMEKSGCSPVGKEWDSANGLQFIRILARDRNKNIVETCALSRGGHAVLITGKTSRSRYPAFRSQFRKIVDSIRPGAM